MLDQDIIVCRNSLGNTISPEQMLRSMCSVCNQALQINNYFDNVDEKSKQISTFVFMTAKSIPQTKQIRLVMNEVEQISFLAMVN